MARADVIGAGTAEEPGRVEARRSELDQQKAPRWVAVPAPVSFARLGKFLRGGCADDRKDTDAASQLSKGPVETLAADRSSLAQSSICGEPRYLLSSYRVETP